MSEPLDAADIQWTSPPIAQPERMPPRLLDVMSERELLHYAYAMQDDIEALRQMLHETLRALATLTRERDALRRAMRTRRG